MAAPTFRFRRLRRTLANRPRLSSPKPGSRCKRPKPRWRGVIWSIAGLTAGISALVGLAHLHGNPPDAEGGFPDPALHTLAKPGVATLVTFGALTMIAWCVRRLRFEFLAWWPGRIVVKSFTADETTPAAEVERLTGEFRDRLGMSHLQSPASVPAPAEQGDFLDVLARNGMDSGNLLGSLLSLLRAAFPAYAYEVNGGLVTGDGPRRCGVTVHVVRSPGKGGGGHTVWDTTWEGAVRQAADHATAAILPRTRICRSPWTAWRRYYMPPALLENYERAAECERKRRYDEALAFYYQALDLDPMNHGLRLQIGFLQEKLGLYLDALDTYASILKVAEPSSTHDFVRRSYRRSARRDRDRTLLIARYRHAVLLGGPGLPHQWRKLHTESEPTRRDAERERLRERLAPALQGVFEDAVESSEVKAMAATAYEAAGRNQPPVQACACALLSPSQATVGAAALPELFLLGSLKELIELRHDLPPSRRWRRRPPLTRAAVRVSGLVVRERLRLELGQARCEPASGWAPYIDQLRKDIRSIEPRSGFDRWQEHYNVACIWSLPLAESCDTEDVEELTRLAVARLECATERADTEFLVSRRDWLVSEDPDLRGLRTQPRFKGFEAAYFPSTARTPQRPRDVHRWEVSRYTLELLRAAAQRWEDTWERRARALEPVTGMRVLLRWCEDELAARGLMRDVALHHRDWRTRFELLDRTREWSIEYGFEPIELPFPDFPAESERGGAHDEDATLAEIEDKDARLVDVVRHLEPADHGAGQAVGYARSGVARLLAGRTRLAQRGVPTRGLPRAHAARLCELHANLWRQLGELATPDATRTEAAQQLARALDETAAACKHVQDHWAAGGRMRQAELHSNGAVPSPGQPVPGA